MPRVQTKQRRSRQACDFCHNRGTRCRLDDTEADFGTTSCATCIEYGEACTWDRPPRKRGTKPGTKSISKKAISWRQRVLRDQEDINSLIDLYLDTIHPVFPLYCERELWIGWKDSKFPANLSQYTSLISMCALSALHAQHGSLFEDERLRSLSAGADLYLTDAMQLLMEQQPDILDLEFLRACGFLALFGIQTGHRSMIHKYLGMYHSFCAQFSLHDESHWDGKENISACELETRRRLYWAMYKLEVHSAFVLGHMIRLPEDQSNVDYPIGLHHPAFVPGRDGDFEDWFSGWNTTTDLYRILEHAIVDFRATKRKGATNIAHVDTTRDQALQQRLADIQAKSLPHFGRAHEKSTDSGRNRCGFQATNILFMIYMTRMFLSIGSPLRMLDAAKTLLDSVHKIPSAYIRACGVPILQDLAGTGLMLGGTAAQSSTTSEEAQALVSIEDALADFLESSAPANDTATTLATRLRGQIDQITRHLALTTSSVGYQAIVSAPTHADTWDEEIIELFRFDELGCESGTMPMHFHPGFLMDLA